MIPSIARQALVTAMLFAWGVGPAGAQKLTRKAKHAFAAKYVGQTFQLRCDLRPVEPYVGTQYVDADGAHFPNYKQPIMFDALERVAIDSVGNLGGNFFIVVAKRAGTSERVVAAEVAESSILGWRPGEDAITRASRESLATVELRLGDKASELTADEQLAAVERLLTHLFFIDSQPSETELISFVKRHRDYPVPVLIEITSFSEARIRMLIEDE